MHSPKVLKYSPQFNKWQGLICSKTSKMLPDIQHTISIQYATISNIFEKKKTCQTVMIDKDDFTFSVVYNLLKIKVKVNVFENISKSLKICSKNVFVWV